MGIDSDLALLLAGVGTAITLLLGVFVIANRARRIEQWLEQEAVVRSDFEELRWTSDRTFVALCELSGMGLHFRQIRREQLRLSEKLEAISQATETMMRLLQWRDDAERERGAQFEQIIEASRSLQEWKSRMTAVYSEAADLFETEPVLELMERFDERKPTYALEAPGRSEETTRRATKEVGPDLGSHGPASSNSAGAYRLGPIF